MKKIVKFTILLSCLAIPFSCDTDFLNTKPIGQASADVTWQNGSLAQAFVFGVYSYLGYGGFEEQALASYTDEAMFTHAGRNINTFTQGTESASNLAWMSDTYAWDKMFKAIRAANTAIANLPKSSFTDVNKDMLLGEVYFLRAYYYHQLLRFYGSFPIIEKLYGLDEDYTIARNTFKECVDFIVADLDKAAQLLDGQIMDGGRASKIAAMALKSRVLIYAASDLRDIPTASANSTTIAGFSNPEIIGYPAGVGGTRPSRWQAAKDAAKAVLDAASGYKLNLSAPVSAAEGKANYVSISMGGGSAAADRTASVELIFQRSASSAYKVEDNWPLGGLHYGINNGPNGYHNWAGNTPIQQLVDDYEMMDGTKFDWSNPALAADPYGIDPASLKRDPRFYASVLYDGAGWKPRPSDVASIDPVDQIQTGYYQGKDSKTNDLVTINGVDTRESKIENWNGSRTHYYTRKFIDPDPAVIDNQSGYQLVPWPFIRYTEVVLNYIEACIELQQESEAKTWLNKIRFRAGMPEVTDAGTALTDRYRNERRIELSYEEHRYHDARRWMIAPTTLGRGIKVMRVDATLKPGATPHEPYKHDRARYDYSYRVQDDTSNETRKWDDKMYYRPIARAEIIKNSKLINNPGY